MKSTIKIDYASSLDGGRAIIKIIRPKQVLELKDYPDGDYDVRDRLLNDFLHHPLHAYPSGLFEVITQGSLEQEPQFYVTTIAPLDNDQQFYRFRHNIINKLVPYNTILSINRGELDMKKQNDSDLGVHKHQKITDFFDWLDKQDWATYEEQHSYLNEGTKD